MQVICGRVGNDNLAAPSIDKGFVAAPMPFPSSGCKPIDLMERGGFRDERDMRCGIEIFLPDVLESSDLCTRASLCQRASCA